MNREKAIKKLGKNYVTEMEVMDEAALKQVVVEASAAIKESSDQLEANEKYQELKLALQEISQAKKEAHSRQKARIAFALALLDGTSDA